MAKEENNGPFRFYGMPSQISWGKKIKGEALFHVQIEILGTIWSSLPKIYRLVIWKQLKNNSISMKTESNQQMNIDNGKYKYYESKRYCPVQVGQEGGGQCISS